MMQNQKMLLRLLTCASEGDGKSTLIEKLLYERDPISGVPPYPQYEQADIGLLDSSYLFDGLLPDGGRVLTTGVSYRLFNTAARRFLIADVLGCKQYSLAMFIAALHADAVLFLIDVNKARRKLPQQIIRYACMASMLGVPNIIFAINKMDKCDYRREAFVRIQKMCANPMESHRFERVYFVPVSALHGDNVCFKSRNMPWFHGGTLLNVLENISPQQEEERPVRFCVRQSEELEGTRSRLSGAILSGSLSVGQRVYSQPSGALGVIAKITAFDKGCYKVCPEATICLQMEEGLDVGRGEILSEPSHPLKTSDQFCARLIWLTSPNSARGRSYLFRLATFETTATITEFSSRLEMETLAELPAKILKPNDIGLVKLALDRAIPFAPYEENHDLGGFLLADSITGKVLAAGMIKFALRRGDNIFWHQFSLNKTSFAAQKKQKPCVLWFTGLSSSGKSSLANVVGNALYEKGKHIYLLDGDNLRHGLNKDLGFTESSRGENIRRAGEVARLMVDAGLIVLGTFISPFRADRQAIRNRLGENEFIEIFVDTPLDVCMQRDPKGLYQKALCGELPGFTGISSPFEEPLNPDLRVDGTKKIEELLTEVLHFLEGRILSSD